LEEVHHIVIDDHLISRIHAEMSADNGKYIYTDSSSNGSYIDGKHLRNGTLRVTPGTRILLANKVPLPWERVYALLPMSRPAAHTETVACSPQDRFNEKPDHHSVALPYDRLSLGWGILAFLIPLAGWIMYAVWHEETPNKAAAAGLIGTVSFILGLISLFTS
jgi:hypothetical protein